MTDKHTPGPWTTGPLVDGDTDERYIAANGYMVAKVRTAANSSQTLADARLIAAAPLMLEALREVAALFESSHSQRGREAHHIASAAIAAATGEDA